MSAPSLQWALGLALVIAALWGVQPVAQKVLVRDLGADLALVLGAPLYLAAVACFVALRWRHIQPRLRRVTLAHVGIAALVTLACAFVANLIFVRLLAHHDSFWVSALAYSSPVVTTLLAMWLLRERVDAVSATGVALVVAGVLLLARHHGDGGASAR